MNINWEEIIFNLTVVIPALLIGVSVHESAHGLSAYWLGDDTAKREGRITLNPIKHITWITLVFALVSLIPGSGFFIPFKPVPIDHQKLKDPRWGAGITAIAGPLSNLLLAVLFVIIGKIIFLIVPTTVMFANDIWIGVIKWIMVFCMLQFSLFVFNLFPIPPLDGHWVLGALIPPLDRVFEMFRKDFRGFVLLFIVISLPPVRSLLMGFSDAASDLILKIWGLKNW